MLTEHLNTKLSNFRSIILFVVISLVLSFLFLSTEFVSAINATGSVYTLSQFSATIASASGNGTDYSGSSVQSGDTVTTDAQGLEYGGVVGITGNAVLTQNKTPVINSYSATPSSANKSSLVRIFISTAYTSQVVVSVTRPDSTIDTINMGSQSVYYYPYTTTLGRYNVRFNAAGNDVVTADTYFDVIEGVTPPVTPPSSSNTRSSGSSSGFVTRGKMYVSILTECSDAAGAKIVVEAANDTSPIYDVSITLKSENTSISALTDEYGMATFDVVPGEYTVTAYNSQYSTISRKYEVYCPDKNADNSIVKNNSVKDGSTGSLDGISGGVSTNTGSASATDKTSDETSKNARIEQPSGQYVMMGSGSVIIIVIAYLSSTIMFMVILLFIVQRGRIARRKSQGVSVVTYPTTYQIDPDVTSAVNPIGFGIYKSDKNDTLTPIEKVMLESEKDVIEKNIVAKDVNIDMNKVKIGTNKDVKKDITENVKIEEKKKLDEQVVPKKEDIKEPTIKDPKKTIIIPEKTSVTEKVSISEKAPAHEKAVAVEPIVAVQPEIKKVSQKTFNVPEGQEFRFGNGDYVRSLPELLSKLKQMDDSVFDYYVTPYNNDFATWIYHAVGDKELANQIGPIKSKKEIIKAIKDRLTQD